MKFQWAKRNGKKMITNDLEKMKKKRMYEFTLDIIRKFIDMVEKAQNKHVLRKEGAIFLNSEQNVYQIPITMNAFKLTQESLSKLKGECSDLNEEDLNNLSNSLINKLFSIKKEVLSKGVKEIIGEEKTNRYENKFWESIETFKKTYLLDFYLFHDSNQKDVVLLSHLKEDREVFVNSVEDDLNKL